MNFWTCDEKLQFLKQKVKVSIFLVEFFIHLRRVDVETESIIFSFRLKVNLLSIE